MSFVSPWPQCPPRFHLGEHCAPIIGLPQDGGVGQPRGIRLHKVHLGWDFGIHKDPRGGKFDSTAILKSWEDLVRHLVKYPEFNWASFLCPRIAELLFFFKAKMFFFFMPISALSLKFYNIRYFSFSFEKRHSYKSSIRSKFTSYLHAFTRYRPAIRFGYSLCLYIC